MTRITKLLLMAATLIAASFAASSPAPAQQGYGPPPKITCSSNNGKRNYCNVGGSYDVRLVRQISGSPCVQGDTWGVDRGGLWVDRGCRAEFIIGRGGTPPPPPARIVTCSSNNGKRNYCNVGGSYDVRLVRQISGSPCIQGNTWGVDRGGLWVDRGCRADFSIGRGGPPPPQDRIVTCSSNNGKRNWCDIGSSRDVRLARQISGSPCIQGSTWGLDNRGLWVDRGCRADFKVRY
jgi:hypothetical protein